MKKLTERSSGKLGDKVSGKGRYGQYEREHVPRTKPFSAAERRAQGEFGRASSGWEDLPTPEQWKAWRREGAKVRSHPSGEGQSGPLTGQAFFTAINNNQVLIGQPPILDPPARPAFGPNPVGALSIREGRGGITLKLSVPTAPAAHILVYGAAPCNAGRDYCDRFVYLGLLPAPQRGMSDITELYVKKHGEPPAGKKVIIWTLQQVNGWRDVPKQNAKRTEVIVPGKPGAAGKPKRD